MYQAFKRNIQPPKLQIRQPLFQHHLKTLTKEVKILVQSVRTLTIEYDGSFDDMKIAASVSVFTSLEEVHFYSKMVHGHPDSSTRAEIFRVIMALRCTCKIIQQKKNEDVDFFGDNSTSITVINQPDEVDVNVNHGFIYEIDFLRQQVDLSVHNTYVKSHQDKKSP